MENRFYVLVITLTSKGTEDRQFTPYDDADTAKRKYHEAFQAIGAGPQFISAAVLDRYLNPLPDHDGSEFKSYWTPYVAPEA